MEEQTCSRCRKKTDAYVRTFYGEICSIECFRKLCDDNLGANEEDFIIE